MHIFSARKRFFSNILFIIVLTVLLLIAPHAASNLNCYECGFEDNLNDCNNFNTSNKDLFIKQCSDGSLGCSTQIKGDTIINMACEDVYFNDCKLANFIEYCYCNTNLCNGNLSIKKPISYNPGLNDDEDLTEGSGFRIFTTANSETVSTSTLQPTIPTPNTGGCLHSTFIIVAAAIFLL
ncbi:hypothetical protein RN001_015957 [Aquatica leii]|uniref:Uncharacterized protein n=1 Tax=Aquatica leii TaxID=1421715 RepID=A0AAN7QAY9_9COLE|nr:hypothetical protein RN001_015957 [Aquatica leii]